MAKDQSAARTTDSAGLLPAGVDIQAHEWMKTMGILIKWINGRRPPGVISNAQEQYEPNTGVPFSD